jgi:head-tail adaptor
MRDLRIEVAATARSIIAGTDNMYRDSRKRFASSGNIFNVVATDTSDYDGMEITVCISSHQTWGPAEKVLKAKAQELTFEERAKAFDRMIAQREEGKTVTDAMKAIYAAIRAEEAAEQAQTIRDVENRDKKRPGKKKK